MEQDETIKSGTPWTWRFGLAAMVVFVGGAGYLGQEVIGTRGQAAVGVVCMLCLAAPFPRTCVR